MKKDSNAFIKILIILVIASLSLSAVVYLMHKKTYSSNSGESFSRNECNQKPWVLEEESSYDFETEDGTMKFKYLAHKFSNENIVADAYKKEVYIEEKDKFDMITYRFPYWEDGSKYSPCSYGNPDFPLFYLTIEPEWISLEKLINDNRGNPFSEGDDEIKTINGIEYIEYKSVGFDKEGERITRTIINDGVMYTFTSSILKDYNGEDQLNYIFENLEFVNYIGSEGDRKNSTLIAEAEGNFPYCEKKLSLKEVEKVIKASLCSQTGNVDYSKITCNQENNAWWIDITEAYNKGYMPTCVVGLDDSVITVLWREMDTISE